MIYIVFLLLFSIQSVFCVVGSGGDVFGQTHFNDIEDFLAGGPVRIDLMPCLVPYEVTKKRFNGTIVGAYLCSTNNDRLSQFFLPYGDLLLTVTGGDDYFLPGPLPYDGNMPTNKVVRDIDAAVLGITDPNFFSIINLEFESITKYVGLFGYYTFMWNEDDSPLMSLQCAVPVMNYFHKIIGKETIYKTGDMYQESPIQNALDGLSRNDLLHQRWNFSPSGMEITLIPRIEFDLSYNYLPMENVSVETYLGCLVPLHNNGYIDDKSNVKDTFIFFPTSLSSQYFGFQYGTTISLFLYHNDERSIKFILGNNLIYFLPNNEIRSFDLDGRSWSRYLNAHQNFATQGLTSGPLTNFLTYNCRVSPNFSNIATTELHYMKDSYNIGVGYSLFARQSESVTILDDLSNIVLQGTNVNIPAPGPLSIVRSVALRLPYEDVQGIEIDSDTGKSIYNVNYYYAKINNTMIDIASATHPAVFCSDLYLKGSVFFLDIINILGGISYRFSHNNTAIKYAGGWVGMECLF